MIEFKDLISIEVIVFFFSLCIIITLLAAFNDSENWREFIKEVPFILITFTLFIIGLVSLITG